ncbi:MAG: hypothetical protein IKZ84_09730, partial [Victivallales bacterium]|nr:hypothetical protein [Victivallales bacterium]
VRPRRHLSPQVKALLWRVGCLCGCMIARCAIGRSGVRPARAPLPRRLHYRKNKKTKKIKKNVFFTCFSIKKML